jgi:hypothetical protein
VGGTTVRNKKYIQLILLEGIQAVLIILCAAWVANDYFVKGAPLLFHNSAEMNATPAWLCWDCERPWVYRILSTLVTRLVMTFGVSLYSATRIQITASVCLFGLAFWYLLKTFTNNQWFTFIIACTTPPLIRYLLHYPQLYFYPYGFTVLFTFTLGLVLLARRKWIGYLVVLFLASLAKETSIFLVCIFAFYCYSKLPKKQYWIYLIAQLSVYSIVRFGLMFIFQNNPGVPVKQHFLDQILVYQRAPGAWILYMLLFFFLLPMFFSNGRKNHFSCAKQPLFSSHF